MPKKRPKSGGLGDRLNKALKNHAQDETTYGPELPAGLNGVAELVEARIGQYKTGAMQGEDFVYLAGVIHEPKRAVKVSRRFENGQIVSTNEGEMTVEGLRTSQMFPLCDSLDSQGNIRTRGDGEVQDMDLNVSRLLNQLRVLGGEDCTKGVGTKEDLEGLLETLREAGVFFRFRTSGSDPTAQYPTERVWENWGRVVEDYAAEAPDEEVQDDTEEEPEAEEEVAPWQKGDDTSVTDDNLAALGKAADDGDEDAAAKLAGQARLFNLDDQTVEDAESWTAVAKMIEAASVKDEDGNVELQSYASLGEPADEGDEDAQEKLTAGAEEAGLDPDEYETWAALAEALDSEEEGSEEDESEGPSEPEKGEVRLYKPPKARKAIECEVTAVFAGRQTANLKDLDSGKVYKAIPWDKLEE